MAEEEKENILLTGFGPFGVHKINPSWEVVKELNNYDLPGYKIVTMEVPVSYKYVDENIPMLWETLQPKLVVHVGVSQYATAVTIETVASRCNYCKKDADDEMHETGEVCCNGPDSIVTQIDVDELCGKLQDIEIIKSTNAGRYLCEYIYYKSLLINPKRTLFIHVPILESPHTAKNVAEVIYQILLRILNSVQQL